MKLVLKRKTLITVKSNEVKLFDYLPFTSLIYRSTHGRAICLRKWLSQFIGYSGGTLKVGSEIDGISGGTISANSISRDIQRRQKMMIDPISRDNSD